mgnify:CR=1 FL=1
MLQSDTLMYWKASEIDSLFSTLFFCYTFGGVKIKYTKMKILKSTVIGLILVSLLSCGNGTSSQPANKKGFTVIEKELKNKFGDDAYYTDLHISYDKNVGNLISVTVTEAPESLKMGQWNLMRGIWKQNSEVSLEVPEGCKAADFMFQLNDQINLSKLGELVEISSEKLKAEKDIENPAFHMAYINFPDNGDISKAEYDVLLKPGNGGTTFTFSYKLNGDFIKMNY